MKSLYILAFWVFLTCFAQGQEAGTFTQELFELRFQFDAGQFDGIKQRYATDMIKKKMIGVEIALAGNKLSEVSPLSMEENLDAEEDYIARNQEAFMALKNRNYLGANKALDATRLSEESMTWFQKGERNHLRGLIYTDWGAYFLALKHLTASEEQFEKANSELGLLVTYYSIIKLFMQSHQWNLATEKLKIVMSKYERAINKYPGLQANYNTLLASDMFVEGKVDIALDYIKENIPIYQKLSDSSNVMKTYMNIGFAHASINNPDSSFFYLKKSQEYVTVLDDKRQEVKILISMMSMLYSEKYKARILNLLGYKNMDAYFAAIREKLDDITDPELELHYLRQKIMYHEKHQEKDAMIKTLEEESDYLYELRNLDTTNLQLLQYQLDLQVAENKSLSLEKSNVESQNRILSLNLEKKKQQQLLYAGIFGAIVLFMIGAWYYTNRIQKERYAKELAARKAEEAGQKLTEAEKALLELKKLILEKTQIIESIQNGLEPRDEEIRKHNAKLRQMKILTNEDWIKFQKLFNTVYPKMTLRLIENNVQLTEGELRILMLYKMKFHKVQISEVLGISPESVRKAVYRLKKKIAPLELDFLLVQF